MNARSFVTRQKSPRNTFPDTSGIFLQATTRFELVIRVLQTHALPLGYVALFNYILQSNPYGKEIADVCFIT